jgi:hypothetical protein
MTQTVIVYRNQTEQAIDQFLYQDGGGVYLFILFVAFAAAMATMVTFDKIAWRAHFRNRLYSKVRLVFGAIAFVATCYLMWV